MFFFQSLDKSRKSFTVIIGCGRLKTRKESVLLEVWSSKSRQHSWICSSPSGVKSMWRLANNTICSWIAYIFVINELHEFEFPIRPFGVCDILEWSGQLLDGHILLRHGIVGSTANILNPLDEPSETVQSELV